MHLICIGGHFLFRDHISITVERIFRGGGVGGFVEDWGGCDKKDWV